MQTGFFSYMGGFLVPKSGVPFWGLHGKGYSTWGSILGSTSFGKLLYRKVWESQAFGLGRPLGRRSLFWRYRAGFLF